MMYQRSGKELYAHSAFTHGSTGTLYAPVIMNNYYGYNTAMMIQNAGDAETDVEVTFIYNGGRKTIRYSTVGEQLGGRATGSKLTPGATWGVSNFGTAIEARGIPSGNTDGLMSAEVRSSDGQPLVLVVTEAAANSRATSYEGQDTGAHTVIAPLVLKRYYNFNTSILCKGAGMPVTHFTVSFNGTELNADGSIKGARHLVKDFTVDSTGRIFPFNLPATELPDLWIGSATIESTEGDFICVVNFDQNEAQPVQNHDYLAAYVALNTTPGAPLVQFAASEYRVDEDAGSAKINVARTGTLSGEINVAYRVQGGTATAGLDYTAGTTGTLTFAQDERYKSIEIPIRDDTIIEDDETFSLFLTPSPYVLDDEATVTIVDNDRKKMFLPFVQNQKK